MLSLKDLFFANEIDCDIDVKVHIIYEQDTDDIINQYIVFCKVLTAQYKQCGQTCKAIEETLRICRDRTWILDNSDDNFQTAMPKIVVFFGFR